MKKQHTINTLGGYFNHRGKRRRYDGRVVIRTQGCKDNPRPLSHEAVVGIYVTENIGKDRLQYSLYLKQRNGKISRDRELVVIGFNNFRNAVDRVIVKKQLTKGLPLMKTAAEVVKSRLPVRGIIHGFVFARAGEPTLVHKTKDGRSYREKLDDNRCWGVFTIGRDIGNKKGVSYRFYRKSKNGSGVVKEATIIATARDKFRRKLQEIASELNVFA